MDGNESAKMSAVCADWYVAVEEYHLCVADLPGETDADQHRGRVEKGPG